MTADIKVFFYGNCQVGTISKHFAENFKNLAYLKGNDQLFPYSTFVWDKKDCPQKQREIIKHIHKKVKDSDVFIFQHHRLKQGDAPGFIEELTTEALCSITNSKCICLPNFRYKGYPNDLQNLTPFIKYFIYNLNIDDPAQICNYLLNDPLDWARSILLDLHNQSMSEMGKRFAHENKLYSNRIDINPFIEKFHKNKLLSVKNMHPTQFYYDELIGKLKQELDLKWTESLSCTDYPAGGINFSSIKFFKLCFPNIDIPDLPFSFSQEKCLQPLTISSIAHAINCLRDGTIPQGY